MFKFRQSTNSGEITPEALDARLQQGENVQVVDVRQPDEYVSGHVAGSQLIPLDQLSARLDELSPDRPLVAVCRSGNRSQVATNLLQRAGYDAVNMKGGLLAWEKARLPLER